MSAIGRIFIVLNLILAAGVVGWASNALGTVEDYKQQKADLTAEMNTKLAEKDAKIAGLESEKNALTDNGRTYREERDDARTRVTELEGLLADAQRTNSEMQGRLAKIDATLGDYNSTIASLTQQKDAAVQRAHEAERQRDTEKGNAEAAELARRDAAGAATSANQQIADLNAQVAALESQGSRLDTQLATAAAVYGFDLGDVSDVPHIEAAVLRASFDSEPGLVMLNVGSNNDVKRGYTFQIFRGGTYKGEVRVENVQADFCSAVITGMNPGTTMAQGDRATTLL